MTLPGLEMLVRVGFATLLGVAIGIERQWRSRMAGLQTMALVSMGAALFLILGAYTFHREQDPTRVAAQIVTGIGFLGAGVIMKQGASVTASPHPNRRRCSGTTGITARCTGSPATTSCTSASRHTCAA